MVADVCEGLSALARDGCYVLDKRDVAATAGAHKTRI